jgi:hypothetical protein
MQGPAGNQSRKESGFPEYRYFIMIISIIRVQIRLRQLDWLDTYTDSDKTHLLLLVGIHYTLDTRIAIIYGDPL